MLSLSRLMATDPPESGGRLRSFVVRVLTHVIAVAISSVVCFAGAVYTVGLPVEGNVYWTAAWPLLGVILVSNVIGAMSALMLLDVFSSRRRPSRPDAPRAS